MKLTFNALLNAESVQQIRKVKGCCKDLTGRDRDDFKRFIVCSYPEFKHHFGSGVGLKLQRKDSDLAEVVMLKFSAMDYACLPVRDSFIVHHGMVGETDFDMGLGEEVEATGDPINANIEELLRPTCYEGRLQAFRLMREQA